MKVAVASGKGGTGKTLLATSLALGWSRTALLDCDVEAPNAHFLIRPEITARETITRPVPRVEEEMCTHCGLCAEFCRFHALAVLPKRWMVFDELCHSCGGCEIVCPTGAITQSDHILGELLTGHRGDIAFVQGRLANGETQPVPIIRSVLSRAPAGRDVIIDSPPGASCSMLTVAAAADIVLLVAEPTPFGLHDLKAAVRAIRALGRPMAVLVNRSDWGDDSVRRLCRDEALPLLLEIPHLREVAEGYTRAIPLIESVPRLAPDLAGLRAKLEALIAEAAA